MTETINLDKTSLFQLKGRMFTLTVLELYTTNLSLLSDMLSSKVQQAPRFFQSTPVAIDLSRLVDPTNKLDFSALIQTIREHGLIPIGIHGGSVEQQTLALSAGLGVLHHLKDESDAHNRTALTTNTSEGPAQPTKVITSPVRSGQQIYAQGGDLLILAPVSTGAEVIADGHIHIYGPLRGRALAGVSGNEQARIFCDSLEAELVSIAGYYKVNENLRNEVWKSRVHVFLDDKTLHINTL